MSEQDKGTRRKSERESRAQRLGFCGIGLCQNGPLHMISAGFGPGDEGLPSSGPRGDPWLWSWSLACKRGHGWLPDRGPGKIHLNFSLPGGGVAVFFKRLPHVEVWRKNGLFREVDDGEQHL